MQKLTLFVLLLLCQRTVFAQKEESNWHFGLQAAVSFANGAPMVQPTSMRTFEAASSVSDAAGQLLFYSNGEKVWNRNHALMPNGVTISSTGVSSTQGVLIVPHPGDLNRYYVFLTDDMENQLAQGLRYTVVDMSLANGLGDVTGPVVRLPTPTLASKVAEKLIAVRHANGRDCWIVVHGWGNNQFYSFLLTNAGLAGTPVTSTIGPVLDGLPSGGPTGQMPYSNAAGHLRGSPDGQHLAMATLYRDLGLYDFDAATGQVSNYQELLPASINQSLRYGVEFSADNSRLYAVAASGNQDFSLLQFNMQVGLGGAIAGSRQVVGTGNTGMGGLLRAPDGKIYMASLSFLHAINAPNALGGSCNFQLNALSLNSGATIYNLPNQFSFRGRPGFVQFTALSACVGAPTVFAGQFLGSAPPLTATWNFGDVASGPANTASGPNATHRYSAAGTYLATFTVTLPGVVGAVGVSHEVQVGTIPAVSLGPAVQQTCGGRALTLAVNPQPVGSRYRWQDGSTAPTFSAAAEGRYSVEVTSPNGCVGRATTMVQLLDCSVVIPNIITPNGDGQNQLFVLKGLASPDWKLCIFSRWGREVFTQVAYDNSWDATGQPDGVYYYLLTNSKTSQKIKGWLEVRR